MAQIRGTNLGTGHNLPPPQALREHFGQVRKMRTFGPSFFRTFFLSDLRLSDLRLSDLRLSDLRLSLYVSKSGPQICTARKFARKRACGGGRGTITITRLLFAKILYILKCFAAFKANHNALSN